MDEVIAYVDKEKIKNNKEFNFDSDFFNILGKIFDLINQDNYFLVSPKPYHETDEGDISDLILIKANNVRDMFFDFFNIVREKFQIIEGVYVYDIDIGFRVDIFIKELNKTKTFYFYPLSYDEASEYIDKFEQIRQLDINVETFKEDGVEKF